MLTNAATAQAAPHGTLPFDELFKDKKLVDELDKLFQGALKGFKLRLEAHRAALRAHRPTPETVKLVLGMLDELHGMYKQRFDGQRIEVWEGLENTFFLEQALLAALGTDFKVLLMVANCPRDTETLLEAFLRPKNACRTSVNVARRWPGSSFPLTSTRPSWPSLRGASPARSSWPGSPCCSGTAPCSAPAA